MSNQQKPVRTGPSRKDTDKDNDQAWLNRIARKIDPPGREPDDDELRDPGNATPDSTPTENRS